MGKGDNTIMWIAAAVGAYLLWQWYQSQQTTVGATGTVASASPSTVALGPGGVPVYDPAAQAAYMAAFPQYSDVGMAASLPAFTGPISQGS